MAGYPTRYLMDTLVWAFCVARCTIRDLAFQGDKLTQDID